MPLDLVFQEDGADRFPHSHGLKRYSAEVIVDRFEPGRRQWNLDRVVYSAKDNKEFSLRFGFQDDDRHGVGAGQFFEVWCTKLPTTREMRAYEACSGPKHYPLDRPDDPNATDIALSPDNDVVQLVLGTRRYESGHRVSRRRSLPSAGTADFPQSWSSFTRAVQTVGARPPFAWARKIAYQPRFAVAG